MSGQRYKRTNFEDDDMSNGGTPPPIDFNPSIMFKGGLTSWQRRTLLERVLIVILIIVGICLIVLATLVAVKEKKPGTAWNVLYIYSLFYSFVHVFICLCELASGYVFCFLFFGAGLFCFIVILFIY